MSHILPDVSKELSAAGVFTPEFEARFEKNVRSERSRRLATEGLIVLVLFCLLIAVDYLVIPEHFVRALVIRFGIVVPVGIAGILYTRSNPVRMARESVVCALTCLGSLAMLVIYTGGREGVDLLGQFSLLLVALTVNVVFRVYFNYAVVSTLALMMGDVLFLWFSPDMFSRVRLIAACCANVGAAITVFTNYSLNLESRMAYMLQWQSEKQRDELHVISNLDRLTNIANRRKYEAHFEDLWVIAESANTPLSLLMIDIDNFKALNDTYGHMYGDMVLHEIAGVLDKELRSQGDLLARYGGEEFVVLLPVTPLAAAMHVAERMRVQVAATRLSTLPEGSIAPPAVTISCGVASLQPMHDDLPIRRQQLVHAADRALYRAKCTGRNRVCSAEEAVTSSETGAGDSIAVAAGLS